jgi:hypothetical protein
MCALWRGLQIRGCAETLRFKQSAHILRDG